MSYLVLGNIEFKSEITKQEFDDDACEEASAKLRKDLTSLLNQYGFQFEAFNFEYIDQKKFSVEKCEECGQFMVNRDVNPAGYEGDASVRLANGATYLGKSVCEDCLPEDHRWSL